MNTVITAAPPVILPVSGSEAGFPVRRVYCVGRNYALHAIEMGHDPTREPPFFFQKNPENLRLPASGFPYPARSNDVHHEVELVVALKSGGTDIDPAAAMDCVWGYAVGIDFTRRDLQADAKSKGQPWAAAKAFEHSGPVSPLVPAEQGVDPARGRIHLSVNGAIRQDGDLAQMTWKIPEIIAELSKLFELAAGDVILTGTPAGVGAVERGDVVTCGIDGIGDLTVTVV
ncbi:5-carboxymethyl-2-hydroxymuconate isomerase [Rhizobium sp. Leaf384]|uniref:fumarylacetoacetate hydrolase family protein n=1 Tax=unclassified Rhizobium TaxID=2613769 RepID=UPI0007157E02|nr:MULTISPECIES: fumarylacetoacetate hydrolase family protein [unclassified Rhizobium]KQS79272.1 5-carboxymethyl-2-hydroxymuconate isomerase [Rhizobium sp. Leaf384]KQS82840.1 5-carboxymethyl-2-hydroxymuconate isomerase [Rhizobium sp. Leaf383]